MERTSTPAQAAERTDEAAALADFLENFRLLCSVPHPSGHEKALCDLLQAWAEGHGFAVRRNAADDLLFDVPATPGLEHLPLAALQAHLDMVCVAREGTPFDPLADPVVPVLDAEAGVLTASGTSLGADDGAGVALTMSIAKGLMPHGPLRILWTTDEEAGMTGAEAVTADDLADVKYLLNIDSEESDTVIVSSAAAALVVATTAPRLEPPAGDAALAVILSGLRGGHSGMEIGAGRCNAIIALARALAEMRKTIPFALASFTGGTADNAIPAKAAAQITLAAKDRAAAAAFLADMERTLRSRYGDREPALALTTEETPLPPAVFAQTQADAILKYVTESMDGVHTMSPDAKGLVESSSNLGLIAAGPDGVEIRQMPRSSVAARLEEIETRQRALGAECGLAVAVEEKSCPWPVKPGSRLVAAIAGAYRRVNGTPMKVSAIHAGLECGAFAALSADLDIASIGPDILGAHSPGETLLLPSVAKTWRLLETLLPSLG